MQMDAREIDAFLAGRHTVILATIKRDGQPQLTTTWYRWDGESFWIATNRDRAKYRNLRRDPRVTLLVDDPPRERSVAAYGRADFVADDADAREGALAIIARYVDDPEGYLRERRGEPRALIRVRPARIVSWKLADE